MKKWQKALLIVCIVLIVLVVGCIILYHYMFGNMKRVALDENELGIEQVTDTVVETNDSGETVESTSATATTIKNIAIFGLSVSESGGIDTDRSDMIMIVSIDPSDNRVCITSILRDSKVPIEGHDPQKINAAYKYGGAPLAIKTLNQNFHLDISDYVTVNFENMEDIVDIFGGVDIEITQDEADFINQYSESGQVTAGVNHMNGEQALLYASIRKIDSDYYRASRQQTVMSKLLEKITQISKLQYPKFISSIMSCVETSLSNSEILKLVGSLDLSKIKLVTNTVPDINYETDLWGGTDDTGSWVYVFDIEKAADRIHNIIYKKSDDGLLNN